MKNISSSQWHYGGYDIYLFQHPALFGKYEVYLNEDFIQRVCNLKEAKDIIKKHKKEVETL